MALTIDTANRGSITLNEYIEFVSNCVDVQDLDAVAESAQMLRSLADNSTFLVERLNRELAQSWDDFQPDNSYSAQTLTLGSGDSFSVRANMWLPVEQSDDEWNQQLYAYELAHDHNFSFLTVGYLGPGYETEIYEYDPATIDGFAGEKAQLTFLEHTSLPRGKVMLYRASRDIHTQKPPPAFSMSLNLLIVSPSVRLSNQYFFDLQKCELSGYVPNAAGGRVMLAELAKYVGNGRTASLLDSVSRRHPHSRLRWAAYDSLAVMDTSSAERIYERAADDTHPFVRGMAKSKLERESA